MPRLPSHPVDASNPDLRGAAVARDYEARIAALERRASGLETAGREIGFQVIRGTAASYSITISVTSYSMERGDGVLMQLFYTPPVNCWWDINAHISHVQKLDAAYNYMYLTVGLNTPDADGISTATHLITQHSGVNVFEGRIVRRRFKLVAGTAYSALMTFNTNGGQWSYYRDPSALWMEATAITR